MIKIYHPWPAPVQAARYDDPSALPEIARWVRRLHDGGLIPEEVSLTVTEGRGGPTVVLTTATGPHALTPPSYLVFTGASLEVRDSASFLRAYREPVSP